ncbi:MAG: undecaprenyl/decaprenyl-phosphate alpha-N-acetylglucosaminyl 1-phosphate transferase [Bdellovibrionales bacterium]|nr:undecaprenyl/decaprenyl-phosphate alpha-N-acetylglucosaminyl 1-phosphate transferase [Bdellovibrionales bacterium]
MFEVILSLFTLLLVIALYYPTRFLAFRLGIIDQPAKRKIHKRPIPRMGGLSIFLGFLVVALFSKSSALPSSMGISFGSILILSTGAFFIGWIDDIFTIGSKRKLLLQTLLGVAAYFLGFNITHIYFGPGWFIDLGLFSCPLTVLWIVAIMNAINLVDGMDGLATGVCAISFGLITLFSIFFGHNENALLAIILMGGCLGFLVHNFNPAKIFMGDCGSMFLGFMLAILSANIDPSGPGAIPVYIPFLVLAFPIVDTLVSIFRRSLRSFQNRHEQKKPRIVLSALKKVLEADGDHIHHRLLKKNLSQKKVAIMLYGFSLTAGMVSLLMLHLPVAFSWIVGMTTIYGIYQLILALEYNEFEPKSKRALQKDLEEHEILNPRSQVTKKVA